MPGVTAPTVRKKKMKKELKEKAHKLSFFVVFTILISLRSILVYLE